MCLICDRINLITKNQNPYFVKELETGYVVIGDHQHFLGYTLFLSKKHVSELHYLDKDSQIQHLSDMALASEAVAIAFEAEKMNIESLGNGDAHLHWHLFPRKAGDLGNHGMSGKGPVWWLPHTEMYSEEKLITTEQLLVLKEKLLKAFDQLESQTLG